MHLLERGVVSLMAWGLCMAWVGAAAAKPSEPTQAQVEAALDVIKTDPNLNATERRLKPHFKLWESAKTKEEKKPPPSTPREPSSWDTTVAEFARFLMWGLGAVLLGVVLWGLRSWIRAGGLVRERRLQNLPSHVRDLDIRPDSLPSSVGHSAWALWQDGDPRGALSLLYRATLSRLVHVHAVPIRGASTEGECLTMARQHLAPSTLNLVEQLVQAWQMTVYGGRSPSDAMMQDLCQRFDVELPDNAAVPRLMPQGATA